jgi:hypothetical protein
VPVRPGRAGNSNGVCWFNKQLEKRLRDGSWEAETSTVQMIT